MKPGHGAFTCRGQASGSSSFKGKSKGRLRGPDLRSDCSLWPTPLLRMAVCTFILLVNQYWGVPNLFHPLYLWALVTLQHRCTLVSCHSLGCTLVGCHSPDCNH
eukprot:4631927-Amphidinium_carterae.7